MAGIDVTLPLIPDDVEWKERGCVIIAVADRNEHGIEEKFEVFKEKVTITNKFPLQKKSCILNVKRTPTEQKYDYDFIMR